MKFSYYSYVLIAAGGFLGAALRFFIDEQIPSLPGTLIVNFLGCFLMGLFMYESIYIGAFSRDTRLFFGMGVIGAFTTFSALAVQSFEVGAAIGAVNLAVNVFTGLIGILAGRHIIRTSGGFDVEPVILVGIGGGIGSILRFELSKVQAFGGIPLGTLVVNAIGSFIFSFIVFSHMPEDIMYLAGIGGLGGFTTFSTFSYESFRMMENHDYYTMGINILLNVAGSITGVALGFLIIQ